MWHPSDRPLTLPRDGAVHIWWIDVSEGSAHRAAGLLTGEEAARADRFTAAQARLSWMTSRGCLRRLLGSYLGMAPKSVAFVLGPHGKPALSGTAGAQHPLAFSVSHTTCHVALAFAREVAVGIDIEEVKAVPELDALINGQCSAEEQRLLLQVTDRQDRTREFLRRWTEKEAIAKALGLGVHLDFHAVSLDHRTGLARLPAGMKMQVRGATFTRDRHAVGAYASVGRSLVPDFRVLDTGILDVG